MVMESSNCTCNSKAAWLSLSETLSIAKIEYFQGLCSSNRAFFKLSNRGIFLLISACLIISNLVHVCCWKKWFANTWTQHPEFSQLIFLATIRLCCRHPSLLLWSQGESAMNNEHWALSIEHWALSNEDLAKHPTSLNYGQTKLIYPALSCHSYL